MDVFTVPGTYSDEDSDDDRVILRRILMVAEDTPVQTTPNNVQSPQDVNSQSPVTHNSAENFGDTDTEYSVTEDTDAETHAFHARGHDKHNETSE